MSALGAARRTHGTGAERVQDAADRTELSGSNLAGEMQDGNHAGQHPQARKRRRGKPQRNSDV